MIEGLFIVVIVVLAGFVTLVSRPAAAPADPVAELERISQHLSWLEERWRHAVAHDYDEQMKAQIADQLADAHAQLAAVRLQIRGR